MIDKSRVLEKLYYEYTHLNLGGKKIHCPYWSNQPPTLSYGPYKGKGTPTQIVKATIKLAQKHNLDLNRLSSSDIKKFMENCQIGVDCSGFVYHMLDVLAKERGKKGIFNFVEGIKGRGVRKVNAFCLTNDKNSQEIKTVREIQIGDMIRTYGGKHVMVVLRIKRDSGGEPKEVVYAHSSKTSSQTGVHLSSFKVKKLDGGLEEQEWLEKAKNGKNFFRQSFKQNKGDGLRRLKIFASF